MTRFLRFWRRQPPDLMDVFGACADYAHDLSAGVPSYWREPLSEADEASLD